MNTNAADERQKESTIMTDWRERFAEVERQAREKHERQAPIRGRQAAIEDLHERIKAAWGVTPIRDGVLGEIDDAELLRDLIYRGLGDAVFWQNEAERFERELLELEANVDA